MPQVPAGWKETTLGEVLILNYGKGLTVEKRINGTIPVYWSSWITGYHNQELVWWPWIIIWRKWSVGKVYFSKQSFYPIDTVYYILPDKNYDLIFIYNLLLTLGLDKMNSDSAVPWLNRDNAYALPIHLPQLPEQQAIAAVLNSFDDKIELLRAENQTLEQMGQELFKERFGKWKVGDELPEGWRVRKLGEEFDVSIGRTPPRAESEWFSNKSIGKKWISIKDMVNSWIYIFNTSEFLTDEAIAKFNIPIIPNNTTILSFKMTVGKLAITTEDMLSNEAIAHFKLKSNSVLSSEFIYCYLYNFDFNSLWSTSSIVTAINSSIIKELSCIIPDQETLSKFDLVIKPLFNKIRANSEQIQSLSATRDQLLPKLMSGEVRVEF